MAYVFNDDKTKANIVVIKGDVGTVSAGSEKTVTISATDLLNNYGIEDITKYVVIGLMQTGSSSITPMETVHFIHGSEVSPIVRYVNSDLLIDVYNNGSSSGVIYYWVVLMNVG